MTMRLPYPRRQRGFSLIELSVATAIYSLGLGSLSLMLLLSVHGTSAARFETTASIQAASLAELILMNSDAAGHYVYPAEPGAAGCDPTVFCSTEEMAAWQLQTWRGRLAGELPGGQGLVCRDSTPDDGDAGTAACDGNGAHVVKVFWALPGGASDQGEDSGRQVLQLPWP